MRINNEYNIDGLFSGVNSKKIRRKKKQNKI